jgi:ubiquinol oxidase
VYSYSEYLAEVDSGRLENVPAPEIAIDYWHLNTDATLRDVIIAVRNDEAGHRDVNHQFADSFNPEKDTKGLNDLIIKTTKKS